MGTNSLIPLPGTDGIVELRQGKDFELQFSVTDEETGEVVDLTGYLFRMQIRKSVGDEDPIIDLAPYITDDAPNGVASVLLPGGVSAAWPAHDVPREEATWIADAEWYLEGSDPERVKDGGRISVRFIPEITR